MSRILDATTFPEDFFFEDIFVISDKWIPNEPTVKILGKNPDHESEDSTT